MPCRQDPIPTDTAEQTELLDQLTRESDRLRELVLAAEAAGFLPDLGPAELNHLRLQQVLHRRADLKRLEDVFRTRRDFEKLGRVVLADAGRPLADQLGFDPDDF